MLASIGLVAATTWWLVGSLDESSATGPGSLDYLYLAPANIGTVIAVAGVMCGIALIGVDPL